MRADRLISLLLLLQTRGQMSASTLAETLGVSVRTIYRDIDALCTSGIPIYADYGRGGGYALVDSYRTSLTGLTENELRALFVLNVPKPLAALGLSNDLQNALTKLAAALPNGHRGDESHVRQRLHLDSVWWFQEQEPVPHLQTLYQAIWEDRQIAITYRFEVSIKPTFDWLIDAYGLVAKAGVWYLVGARDHHFRAYRVSHLTQASLTDQHFIRKSDFNLAAFWQEWCRRLEANRPLFPVKVRVAPDLFQLLPRYFGGQLTVEAQDTDKWRVLTLTFDSFESARQRILGFGRAIEVLEPEALRNSVLDFAQQIVDFYRIRE